MGIVVVGTNHQKAPVELREKLACVGEVELCDVMGQLSGVQELLVLSTCNRVDLLMVTGDHEQGIKSALSYLSTHGRGAVRPEDLYVLEGADAVTHLFKVAASLDSMILGEAQILGQVKDAYRRAVDSRTSGVILNRLLHRSFFLAKRVRTETNIGSSAVSVASAAVEMARKIFGTLTESRVLLVGAGDMAELACEHLAAQGVREIVVANRSPERGFNLARRFKGRAVGLSYLMDEVTEADIVILSTGSPEYIVAKKDVKPRMRKRRNRPIFFIDIAVPRDADPGLNDLDNVYLYDIDDLGGVVEANRALREEEAVYAQRLVEEEVIKFLNWLESLKVVPTIVSLKDKAEEIRVAELGKTLHKIGPVDPEVRDSLEILTSSIVNKLLNDPILYLKEKGTKERGKALLDTVRRLFKI